MSEEPLPSLLGGVDAQGALFSLPASFREAMESEGRYTGERLFRDRPDIYEAVVALLAERTSVRGIKRAVRRAFGRSIHHDTIDAIAVREKIPIDTLNERIVRNLGLLVEATSEVLIEKVESAKPGEAGMILGISFDKLQLATGGATMRVETTDLTPAPQPKSFDEWLDGMKRVDTGSGGGEKVQTGPTAVHRLPAPDGLTDSESLASKCVHALATGLATGPGMSDPGEGGVDPPRGADSGPTHSQTQNFAGNGDSPAPPASSSP